MKKLLLICSILLPFGLFAQTEATQAFLDENSQVQVRNVTVPDIDNNRASLDQIAGFPKKMAASPSFKNMRGVTLADINGDDADEILASAYNTMNVYDGDGAIVWTKALTGTAIYPPSVAQLDQQGTLGIVVVTGGSPNNGRIYLMDTEGNDMPGWPLSFENHWIICGPVIADVTGDGVSEIICVTRTSNNLHVLKQDGTPLSDAWPVNLGGTPAVTPSVGDIDNDGVIEIVAAISNGTLFAIDANGNTEPGFPVESDGISFSYQSPLLVDFDDDETLSIVGTTHGDAPKFFIREHDGSYRDGWPFIIPDASWTYAPPTVVDITGENDFRVFMSRPITEDPPLPMLYGFYPDGSQIDNFPIIKSGGLEGFTSVADINGDGEHDLIFGSNLKIDEMGFIHAYKMDGTEIEGFPLRPNGFTFMNGANLGDVNGDGIMDIVALSYELTFQPTDSLYINAYSTNIPLETADILFGTYKGSNDRSGLVKKSSGINTKDIPTAESLKYSINRGSVLNIFNAAEIKEANVFNLSGKIVSGTGNKGSDVISLNISTLNSGMYLIKAIRNDGTVVVSKFLLTK